MRKVFRRRNVVMLLLLAVAWAGLTTWLFLDAARRLDRGQDALNVVRNDISPATLLDDSTDDSLDRAGHEFSEARSRLRNPLLTPLRVLPVIGRHVRAADHVTATSAGATEIAAEGVAELRELTREPLDEGADRLRVLGELADLMERSHEQLSELDPGSPDALVSSLSDAVVDVTELRDDALEGLGDGAVAARALVEVLEGPRPYLLLGSNNAEMRAGGGMYLSATTLRFDAGTTMLDEVRPTHELLLPPGTVEAGGDMAANWPWLDAGRDFRSLGLTADFPQSAEVAARMWEHVPGGEPVAGVIAVDVEALRKLIGVVGPVEVDGVSYTVESVAGQLLRDQYALYGDRDVRRDRLGEVARAVFTRFEAGEWSLEDMATALIDSVQGRHLMIWSVDEEASEAWAGVGADGHLTDTSLVVSLMNRGANKLDSYVETALDVSAERTGSGGTALTLSYDVTNASPETGPAYVLGPNIEGMALGEYRGIVVVNLPAGSTDVDIEGATPTLVGADGPTVVVGGSVEVQRGQSATIVVTAILPPGVDTVTLEASARLPRSGLVAGGEALDGDRRITLDLDRVISGS